MKNNEKEYRFIKGFTKIKLKYITDKLKISRSSVLTGQTTDENLSKVRCEIQKEFAKLFLED